MQGSPVREEAVMESDGVSLAGRAIASAKKSATKNRLAYLLLDVFLGGFIVGIVLMMTLGRPPEETVSEGAGGEEFLLIEYKWNNSDLNFNPVLKYQNAHIHPYGLSSQTSIVGETVWSKYEINKGLLDENDLLVRFDSIRMDGFFADDRFSLQYEDGPGTYYGYLLLSKPCPGQWSTGMRIIGEHKNTDDNRGYKVEYKTTCGGYKPADQCNMENWAVLIESTNVNTAGGAFKEMKTASGFGVDALTQNIPVIDSEKEFEYCGSLGP